MGQPRNSWTSAALWPLSLYGACNILAEDGIFLQLLRQGSIIDARVTIAHGELKDEVVHLIPIPPKTRFLELMSEFRLVLHAGLVCPVENVADGFLSWVVSLHTAPTPGDNPHYGRVVPSCTRRLVQDACEVLRLATPR